MATLATHYQQTRNLYPTDKLMIIFDIDGTILDMRSMVLNTLKAYDRAHATNYFATFELDQITVHENRLDSMLRRMQLDPIEQHLILDWYLAYRWTTMAIMETHRAFSGVLEVIRWFQSQPNTAVGLNTGRPDKIRKATLDCLNQLGVAADVHFDSDKLYMNRGEWEADVMASKVKGVQHYQAQGYRVFAFVDNEPENLAAIATYDTDGSILLLHADTIWETDPTHLPSRAIGGDYYNIQDLQAAL